MENPGYGSLLDGPEQESIEVNLAFDDDDDLDDSIDFPNDNFDQIDGRPPSPVESFTMDTPSIHSENFYEELEPL